MIFPINLTLIVGVKGSWRGAYARAIQRQFSRTAMSWSPYPINAALKESLRGKKDKIIVIDDTSVLEIVQLAVEFPDLRFVATVELTDLLAYSNRRNIITKEELMERS